jgi:assimilatory nitrate reductase catalytic subunit
LTTSSFCEKSKQPELKHAAVHIAKVKTAWSLLAVSWLEEDILQDKRAQLQALMKAFDYAYCLPFGHERAGLVFRASSFEVPDRELIESVQGILSFDAPGVLHYEDAHRGVKRSMILHRMEQGGGESEGQGQGQGEGDAKLTGFLLAGDLEGQDWLEGLLRQEASVKGLGRYLLQGKAPSSMQMSGVKSAGMVCTCIGVSELQIHQRLSTCAASATPQDKLKDLQDHLQCGTSCGSCVPQLKRMIAVHQG